MRAQDSALTGHAGAAVEPADLITGGTMTTLHEKAASGQAQRIPINEPARPDDSVNIGNTERAALALIGSGMAIGTMVRPRISTLVMGIIGGGLIYRSITGHCPMYAALKINTARQGRARPHDYFESGIHVNVAVTIEKPADELYQFWRDFENLPSFMRHLQSVRRLNDEESHWVACGPAGTTVEWDAQIINRVENELIAWRSKPDADVDNAGSVRFIPSEGGRGTRVDVTLEYLPPGGRLGSFIAMLFGEEPGQQIQEDLRRFKQLMETGEVATIEGQPRGTCK
jgi:uncharacterized membrane protein